MVIGVGIDVVDIGRFERALNRTPRLRDRLFTEHERALGSESLAARFAAKEALAKALGASAGWSFGDVTVHRRIGGRPELELRGGVRRIAEQAGASRMHVSLSHDAAVATAVVIVEGGPA